MVSKKLPIYVLCPGNTESGGPELLHQFVDSLRQIGEDAYLIYYPFSRKFYKPEKFRSYDAPCIAYENIKLGKVVVSEVSTNLIKFFKGYDVSIWWASVDFYFGIKGDNSLLDSIRYLRCLIFRRLPLYRLKKYKHYSQSLYAKDFLRGHGIESSMLSDYLNKSHLDQKKTSKKDLIAYNPFKGLPITNALKRYNPDIRFVPIIDLTPQEVRDLLASAKIYVDFGNHPGKDRLPREAAMANCCVITGIKGSANFDDIAIPRKFKLNEKGKNFMENFRNLTLEIFNDYDALLENFEGYRQITMNEEDVFHQQVNNIFGDNDDKKIL